MAENNETKAVEVVEKKENKVVRFCKNHKEGIITFFTTATVFTLVGYGICKVTHYESEDTKLDDVIETLSTPEVSEELSDTVDTPELDVQQNPEV